MSLLVFLLKSSCCLAAFLLFYKLVLEREHMHVFKRFYLLTALLLSFIIPTITFTEYVEPTPAIEKNIVTEKAEVVPIAKKTIVSEKDEVAPNFKKTGTLESTESQGIASEILLSSDADSSTASSSSPPPSHGVSSYPISIDHGLQLIWFVYLFGILVFALKFLWNFSMIIKNIRRNPKTNEGSIKYVLLKETVVPHTFFSFVFLNRYQYERKEIPAEVLLHERAHADQLHSFDILLIELFQVVFWFNPLLYLCKTCIKLNHEFLADRAVIDRGTSTPGYQQILLTFASSANVQNNQSSLANAINYSSIKKRFKIMKTQTSRKSKIWRVIFFIPMLALLLYGFSSTVQIPKPIALSVETQEGAKEKQLKEYNTLAKKYNDMLAKKGNIRIKKQDVDRLEHLYALMTESQRAKAETFPDFPEPPEPPMPPTPPNQNERNAGQNTERNAAEMSRQEHRIEKREEMQRIQPSSNESQEANVQNEQEQLQAQVGLSKKQEAEIKRQIEKTVKQVEKIADQEAVNQLQQLDIEKLMEDVQLQIENVMQNTDIAAIQEEALQEIIENQEIYDELRSIDIDGVQSIILDENRDGLGGSKMQTYIREVPSPAEPPVPQSPLSFLEEFQDEDVLIILNGKEIDYESAVEVARNATFSKVHIKRKTGKRPVIKLKTR